jgi:hypothetical protein
MHPVKQQLVKPALGKLFVETVRGSSPNIQRRCERRISRFVVGLQAVSAAEARRGQLVATYHTRCLYSSRDSGRGRLIAALSADPYDDSSFCDEPRDSRGVADTAQSMAHPPSMDIQIGQRQYYRGRGVKNNEDGDTERQGHRLCLKPIGLASYAPAAAAAQ